MPSRTSFCGFSLIEIAAVLVVSSLMAAFVLPQLTSTSSFNNVSCYNVTREQLDTVKAALLKYARAHERFPSPAKRNVASSSGDYGRESTAGIETPGSPADYGLSNSQVSIGALPWATLGLTSDYAGDCWGNKYSYMVTTALTKADTAEGYMQDSIYGNIIVEQEPGRNVTDKAAFAVISHGEDGLGAAKLNYTHATSSNWCTAEAVSRATQNCRASNNLVVDAPFNNGKNAGTNYFDDVVVTAEKPNVLYTPNTDVGKVYGWGKNNHKMISSSGTLRYHVPTLIEPPVAPDPTTFTSAPRTPTSTGYLTSISVGMYHVCGVAVNGHAYCWGDNYSRMHPEAIFTGQPISGKLGRNNLPGRIKSSAVSGGQKFSSVTAGRMNSCGINTAGDGYCWGQTNFGILGNGDSDQWGGRSQPDRIQLNKKFSRIVSGYSWSCGIAVDRDLYCWGFGNPGQLGDGIAGSNSSNPLPKLVINGHKFLDVSLGGEHFTCGIKIANITDTKGDVYCWGHNASLSLGRNTSPSANRLIPMIINMSSLPAGMQFTKVSAGGGHACALAEDGRVVCWGNNDKGQVGDSGPNNTGHLLPLLLGSRSTTTLPTLRFRDIAAGAQHTCGITIDNKVFCWGSNQEGQLAKADFTSYNFFFNETQMPLEIDYGPINPTVQVIKSIAASGNTTFITVEPTTP